MSIDRLTETLKVYETICDVSNSRVLSPLTLDHLAELKARLELEIAEIKSKGKK
jgi:hypothetical protein